MVSIKVRGLPEAENAELKFVAGSSGRAGGHPNIILEIFCKNEEKSGDNDNGGENGVNTFTSLKV